MATDLYTVEIQAKSTGVAAATAEMEKLGKQSSLASTAVKLFGAAAAGLSVGAIFQKITQDTIGFTKSISELSAITGATGKDLQFYEEQAALIGKTTTLSASQAADAFKLIASAKPDLLANKEALAAVTKEAVKLAEAAGIGLADAASTVGVSLNQFGAGAEEASRFVNVLAAGAKEGSSSITDTAQAMKNAGVAANLAGLSFEEANVGVQLLAKGGLFAAEAGTGFRQVLLKLENEADDRFKPSMVGLAGALENLAAENMSLTELTGLFGAEAMKSAAIMINGAHDARKLERAITGTSTATEMAQTNFDNMTGDLLSLNSANEGLAITMGKMLEPIIRKVIQATTEFSRKVDAFVRSEKFTTMVKALTIGLQGLSIIIATKTLLSFNKMAISFVGMASKAGLAATATGLFSKALTLIGGPIGLTVTALFALYNILKEVFGIDFDTYVRYFKAIGQVTKEALVAISASWNNFSSAVKELISAMFTSISTAWNNFSTYIKNIVSGMFNSIGEFFQPYINSFVNTFTSIKDSAATFTTNFINTFVNTFTSIKDNAVTFTTNFINTFISTFTSIKNNLITFTTNLTNTFINTFTTIKDNLITFATNFSNVFRDAFVYVSTLFQPLIDIFVSSFTGIKNTVDVFITNFANGFRDVFQYLSTLFQPLIDLYVTAFNAVWDVIGGFFTTLTDGATTAINFVVSSFNSGFFDIRKYVETTKININAFYETMKAKASAFFDSEEETARKLATINENKAISLQAVNDKYADMATAQKDTSDNTSALGTVFTTFGDLSETVSTTFGTFASNVSSTADAMDTTNTNLNTLGDNLDEKTSVTGSFGVAAVSLSDMASSTGDVDTNMIALEGSAKDAALAIGGADGKGGLTLAQTTFQTAVENTQTAWATLIKETITNGKLDFGSFFDTVKSGFVTMVSEIASQNITNAIFGQGGLSGFLSNLTNGFGSIISSIASGLGGIISSFVSNLTGLQIGGTAASTGSAAASGAAVGGIGSTIAGAMGAATQFVSGAMGTAVGTTATSVGPPTAAALAGSGFKASLATMGSKALAFMTNPLTLAFLGTALVAKMLDKGGTPTSTVGMTMAKTGGMSDANIFQTSPFASGFAPLGFKQNGTNSEAEQAMQPFRDLDMTLTEVAKSLGYNVNLAGHTFNGYGVEGTGAGTVMGSFVEEGKVKGTPIEQQMDRYATEWVHAVGVRNGLSAQVIRDIQGSGTFEDVLANSTRMPVDNDTFNTATDNSATTLSVDGRHQSGLGSVPYDGYIAELHAGERVQTRAQVAATDRMSGEMVGLRNNLNELMLVVAKAVTKTARIEDRWDKNGLPPVRA
jgi:TP901 family phage tail tape measure protein